MIIKSKTHRSRGAYHAVLGYIFREEARYRDSEGRELFVRHNVMGRPEQIDFMVKQFRDNLDLRSRSRSDNIQIVHEILSFHPEDSHEISSADLKTMTRAWIEKRGPQGMYVAVAHGDKEHVHVHVVSSPLEFGTGKSMRLSRAQFSTLQQSMQELQQERFPHLSRSVVEYGSKKKPDSDRPIGRSSFRRGVCARTKRS